MPKPVKGKKAECETEARLQQFLRDRIDALLSMDEDKIRAFHTKYNPGGLLPLHPEAFWRAVHKAITAIPTIPMNKRVESKRWLIEHGSAPMDDGDVPVEDTHA